jgi:hypothetical protein
VKHQGRSQTEPTADSSGAGDAESNAAGHYSQITGYIAGEVRTVAVNNELEVATVLRMIVDSSVESALEVELEPVTIMSRWRYVRVRYPDGRRTRHLVGWAEYEGRVCSAVVSIDPVKHHLTTRSGRVYQLQGLAGNDRDAAYVFRRWLSVQGVDDTAVSEQTKALTRAFARAAEKAKAGKSVGLIRAKPP